MIIQKIGAHCFKFSAGPVTLALNPPDAKSKLKVNKFGSDVVLVSLRHADWDGAETASHGDKKPFVVAGPGAGSKLAEAEKHGVKVIDEDEWIALSS